MTRVPAPSLADRHATTLTGHGALVVASAALASGMVTTTVCAVPTHPSP